MKNPLDIFKFPLWGHQGQVFPDLKKAGWISPPAVLEVFCPPIHTPEDAKSLTNHLLYIAKSDLPALDLHTCYWQDLKDMRVVFQEKNYEGRVREVCNYGAGDILDILFDDGFSCLIPFSDPFVQHIDQKEKRIVLGQDPKMYFS